MRSPGGDRREGRSLVVASLPAEGLQAVAELQLIEPPPPLDPVEPGQEANQGEPVLAVSLAHPAQLGPVLDRLGGRNRVLAVEQAGAAQPLQNPLAGFGRIDQHHPFSLKQKGLHVGVLELALQLPGLLQVEKVKFLFGHQGLVKVAIVIELF